MNVTEPKFAGLPQWCQLSGMNRSATYDALGRGDLRAVKMGRRTLIDVEAGLAWLRSLPPPQTRTHRIKSEGRAPKQKAA